MSDKPKRLKELIKALEMSQKEFADKTKKSPAQINNYTSGRDEFGGRFIEDVKSAFPRVDLNWLLTGQGDMFVLEIDGTTKEMIDDLNAKVFTLEKQYEDFKEDITKLFVKHLGKVGTKIGYEVFVERLDSMLNEPPGEYKKSKQ